MIEVNECFPGDYYKLFYKELDNYVGHYVQHLNILYICIWVPDLTKVGWNSREATAQVNKAPKV